MYNIFYLFQYLFTTIYLNYDAFVWISEANMYKYGDILTNLQRNAEIERPSSVYDNLDHVKTYQIDYPMLSEDVSDPLQSAKSSTSPTSSPSKAVFTSLGNSDVNIRYENVVETIQLRNSLRQQQLHKLQLHVDEKPAISDAKSSFFGISYAVTNSPVSKDTSAHSNTTTLLNFEFRQAMPNMIEQLSHLNAVPYASAPPGQGTSSNGDYQNIPLNSAIMRLKYHDNDNMKHANSDNGSQRNSTIETNQTNIEGNSTTQVKTKNISAFFLFIEIYVK